MVINDYIIVFIVINTASFLIMGIDKLKARKKMFRVSEKAIISFAIFFGALGVYIGMYIFRHKTKKKKFYITIPVLMLAQLFLLYYFVVRL